MRTLQALTSGWPVDTGYSRGRWEPSVGTRLEGVVRRPASDAAATAQGAALFAANQAKAQGFDRGYRLSMGPYFLTNPSNYAGALAAGSSAQAPAGVIERAIQSAINATIAELNAGA